MRLAMAEKRVLTRVFAEKYSSAKRSEKTELLDQFTAHTGYNRAYEILKHADRQRRTTDRRRPRVYDDQVRAALVKLWQVTDCICGKRLVPILPELMERLIHFGEMQLHPELKEKLARLSPATADRLLRSARDSRGRSRRVKRNPNSYLFAQIPIRTFAEWDNVVPGSWLQAGPSLSRFPERLNSRC